ncbi:ribbon-helix-helix protein, CopG family [Ramlibacter sp.]|uniref:ribbon-helix-helix protein, CopG family n=1 Tax=Ramlibacter sp. TaxID=1917967 RepID=UPI002615B109|nr:ribbon-helix-helix protein, CopG family [Ramlibacter sp.]
MEAKPARLTILIDADKKKAFEAVCAAQDITVSQVLRQLIREYIVRHQPHDHAGLPRRRGGG